MTPTSRNLSSRMSPDSLSANKCRASPAVISPDPSDHIAAEILSEIIEHVEDEITSKSDTILPDLSEPRNLNETTNTLDDSLHTNDLGDPTSESLPASLN